MERAATSYRLVAPATSLAVFFFMTALYVFGDRALYGDILRFLGVASAPFGPFLDMQTVVAAWQCHRLGIDVFVQDPCDLLGRNFTYSPVWLLAAPFPLSGNSLDAIGFGFDLLFLLSLFLLPLPRRARDMPALALAMNSTMVWYALERANADIIIFLLAVLTGLLALRSSRIRFAAYSVAFFAGMLKYYPLTLLSLTLRERLPRFLAINVTVLALGALFAIVYFPELEKGLPSIPGGSYFTDLFAAENLPFGGAQILGVIAGVPPTLQSSPFRFLAYGIYALLAVSAALICQRILRLPDFRGALTKLTPPESMFLMIGSILVVGCFFAGQSVDYRGIFLLFALPGFLALSRSACDEGVRVLGSRTSLAIGFLMWGEFLRTNLSALLTSLGASDGVIRLEWVGFWLFREMVWWWTVSVMAAVILHFLSEAGVGLALSTALMRRSQRERIALH